MSSVKAMYFCPRPSVYLPSLQSAHSQRLAFHDDLPLLTPSKSSSSSSEMHCLILARRTATGQRASGPTLLGKYISMAWMPTLEGLLGISNWVIFAENGLVVWIQEVNRMLFKKYLGGATSCKVEDNNQHGTTVDDARDPDRRLSSFDTHLPKNKNRQRDSGWSSWATDPHSCYISRTVG